MVFQLDNLRYEQITIKSVVHHDAHVALRLAQQDCKLDKSVFIATLPDLIRWRIEAPNDPIINQKGTLLNSEELYIITPRRDVEHIIIHGGGFFTDPSLVYQLDEGWPDRCVKINTPVAFHVLCGIKLPPPFPMFTYNNFIREERLPHRYGVRIEHRLLQDQPNGLHSIDTFYNHPVYIARCGGLEPAYAYLDQLADKGQTHIRFTFEAEQATHHYGYALQTMNKLHIGPYSGDTGEYPRKARYLVAHPKRFTEGTTYRDPARER